MPDYQKNLQRLMKWRIDEFWVSERPKKRHVQGVASQIREDEDWAVFSGGYNQFREDLIVVFTDVRVLVCAPNQAKERRFADITSIGYPHRVPGKVEIESAGLESIVFTLGSDLESFRVWIDHGRQRATGLAAAGLELPADGPTGSLPTASNPPIGAPVVPPTDSTMGWKLDPWSVAGRRRYWDGDRWTAQTSDTNPDSVRESDLNDFRTVRDQMQDSSRSAADSFPAGWYPDPWSVAGRKRWWDGDGWTARVDKT